MVLLPPGRRQIQRAVSGASTTNNHRILKRLSGNPVGIAEQLPVKAHRNLPAPSSRFKSLAAANSTNKRVALVGTPIDQGLKSSVNRCPRAVCDHPDRIGRSDDPITGTTKVSRPNRLENGAGALAPAIVRKLEHGLWRPGRIGKHLHDIGPKSAPVVAKIDLSQESGAQLGLVNRNGRRPILTGKRLAGCTTVDGHHFTPPNIARRHYHAAPSS